MTRFLIILTLNAAKKWPALLDSVLSCVSPEEVLIIDSGSTDGTVELARESGFKVHSIPLAEFNHGGTRQLALQIVPNAEILIYLTQDAILANCESVSRLVLAFEDPGIGAAFGRQLPHFGSTPIEAHARVFNYGAQSSVRSLQSRDRLGMKTIFISNSFAAYRREALIRIGGFQSDVIFGEDTIAAARLLLTGWKISYVADAQVYHSHHYTWGQEFRRYFDIGVLHSRESWILDDFGQAEGEGRRFVISELKYLYPTHALLVPSSLIRTAFKLLGYKLGKFERHLNISLKRKVSMNVNFWK